MRSRRVRHGLGIAAAAITLLLTPCFSQLLAQQSDEGLARSIAAIRTDDHPKIDGTLNDACWKRAPRSGDFIQHEPEDGKAATESTVVRVAYDNEALYVGMEMYDSEPGRIVNRLARRDADQNADCAVVVIDSYHDHQTAYAFLVYASGTQQDAYHYNDTWSDGTWDAVWESATRITEWGWAAEFKIPFDCLRFVAADDPEWGILFLRGIPRKNEVDRWVNIPESVGGYVSRFGHLTGLENIRSPRQLEILPYGVSYEKTEPTHPGNPDGRDIFGNAGVDLKYGITPNITMNTTINPDFGQVEADEIILNLTTFETRYPEKRPFFIEGSKIFETYFNLFYSRRIGRAPSGQPENVADYVDRPDVTTILGAAKVSGKTAGRTSIGILEAVTQRERAKFIDGDNARHVAVIEPEANYLVTRVEQDVLKNSKVGIMATAASQKTLHPAYTGGVDWILRFNDGDYASHGQIVGSSTESDEAGWGGFARLAKEGGKHITANIDLQYMDKKLDLNRIGYQMRNNIREVSTWLQYRTTKRWWIVNRTWNTVYADRTENLDGLMQNYGCNFDTSIELRNYWAVELGGWVDFGRTYFDWPTQGGPPMPIPLGQSWHAGFNTDGRKWWQLAPSVGGGDTWDGQFNTCQLSVSLRPRSNMELSMGPEYKTQRHVSQYLKWVPDESGNRQYIFGEMRLHQLDMTLRGTFTFSKDLTLLVYAQPFVSARDYRNFKKLVPPDTYDYVGTDVYDGTKETPDRNRASFNSNVTLRWEYRPGSTLFLVWTQAREYRSDLGDFGFKRDWDNLFGTVPGNTFLIKANYRLSM